jgi:hypothetical protein
VSRTCPASPGRAVTPQKGQMGARPSSSMLIHLRYVANDGKAFGGALTKRAVGADKLHHSRSTITT